jgi:hypothetical protein
MMPHFDQDLFEDRLSCSLGENDPIFRFYIHHVLPGYYDKKALYSNDG